MNCNSRANIKIWYKNIPKNAISARSKVAEFEALYASDSPLFPFHTVTRLVRGLFLFARVRAEASEKVKRQQLLNNELQKIFPTLHDDKLIEEI